MYFNWFFSTKVYLKVCQYRSVMMTYSTTYDNIFKYNSLFILTGLQRLFIKINIVIRIQ